MEPCECGHGDIMHYPTKKDPSCMAPGCKCKGFKERKSKNECPTCGREMPVCQMRQKVKPGQDV